MRYDAQSNPFVKVEEVPKVGIEPDAETAFKQATKGAQEKQTIAAAENNAIDIENKSKTQGLTSAEEKSWWSKTWENTKGSFDPAQVGIVPALSNVQNVAGMFQKPEEDPWGFRGSGLQDYHSGLAQYRPDPSPFDMAQPLSPNLFGMPTIQETLQYYGLYTPEPNKFGLFP